MLTISPSFSSSFLPLRLFEFSPSRGEFSPTVEGFWVRGAYVTLVWGSLLWYSSAPPSLAPSRPSLLSSLLFCFLLPYSSFKTYPPLPYFFLHTVSFHLLIICLPDSDATPSLPLFSLYFLITFLPRPLVNYLPEGYYNHLFVSCMEVETSLTCLYEESRESTQTILVTSTCCCCSVFTFNLWPLCVVICSLQHTFLSGPNNLKERQHFST